MPKKTTVGKYLELVKQQLVNEFSELRGVSAENLLYVKEDLIIPHVRVYVDCLLTTMEDVSCFSSPFPLIVPSCCV